MTILIQSAVERFTVLVSASVCVQRLFTAFSLNRISKLVAGRINKELKVVIKIGDVEESCVSTRDSSASYRNVLIVAALETSVHIIYMLYVSFVLNVIQGFILVVLEVLENLVSLEDPGEHRDRRTVTFI